mmetsp:Transcript_2424/g.5675  ORF Transcript_2424/g.5675 Transcript_2424/m.5675 type:complete len:186 (+) Transcript_2424:1008-1565(+)
MNFLSGIERADVCCVPDASQLLPQISCSKNPDLRFITSETLAELMLKTHFRNFKIVDCRFEYEFLGGHIKTSVNANSPDDLLNTLRGISPGTLLIFHCEFSQLRGPSMCRWLRNYDRTANCENYPRLDYPDLYILQGGYADFFCKFRNLCDPCEYVPADSCKPTMRVELKAFNKRLKPRSRTTFA